MSETKVCNKCQENKPTENFYFKNGIAYGSCKKCCNLANKLYREANRESVAKTKAAYSIDNKEKLNETSKLWDIENHDRKLETMKNWAKSCPEKRREYKAKRSDLKRHSVPSWMTTEELNQIDALYTKATQLTIDTGIPHHVDHLIPIVNDLVCGFHVYSNLQILTAKDNLRKSNFFTPYVDSEIYRQVS